jgi:hypothetical protein
VHWNDGHQGVYKKDFLKKYSSPNNQKLISEFPVLKSIPKLSYSSIEKEEGLFELLEKLNIEGVCLLQDVPLEFGCVEKVANKIGHVRETTYGKVFKVISSIDPDNIAYTSFELKPHMDLV